MKLRKQVTATDDRAAAAAGAFHATMDRRTFLKRSGVTAGGMAALGSLPLSMMTRAEPAAPAPEAQGGKLQQVRSVCTHCPVG